MSQKNKGKQSNNIHRQKLSKIQSNRKIEKSLQVAQKRGTKVLQVSNPKTFGNRTSDYNNSQFSKGCICQSLCWEPLDVVFLKNQSEISPRIPLDHVSSKHNVVFNTAVKWMPKRNISNAAAHKA